MTAITSISTAGDTGTAWDRVAQQRDAHASKAHQGAVADAKQALAAAESRVDEDKRNHSPGCVACDGKLVDAAQRQLAQANAAVQADQAASGSASSGSVNLLA